MSRERIFLDTSFVMALLNRKDRYHEKAKKLLNRLRTAYEVWITESVLTEIGNAFASSDRSGAADFIESCYKTPNIRVVATDTELFKKSLKLYRERKDKDWGLTDCISFVVMKENSLYLAMTADKHFSQAGFCPLMLS